MPNPEDQFEAGENVRGTRSPEISVGNEPGSQEREARVVFEDLELKHTSQVAGIMGDPYGDAHKPFELEVEFVPVESNVSDNSKDRSGIETVQKISAHLQKNPTNDAGFWGSVKKIADRFIDNMGGPSQ